MRISRFFIAVLSVASCAWISPATALECKGEIENHHNDNGYVFTTSSSVYQSANVHIYETCVTNKDDSRYLDFDWYIPGPHSWIPPGESLPNPRRRVTRDTIDGQEGCLRFGNEWIAGSADFLPHATDGQALEQEAALGCEERMRHEGRTTAGQLEDFFEGGEDIFPFQATLEIFAPSNSEFPAETMTRVQGKLEVVPSKEGTYFEHSLTILTFPIGPKALADTFRLIPNLDIVRTAYSQTGFEEGLLMLSKFNEYRLTMETPKRPVIREIRYQLVNDSNEHVATMFVPFWVEASEFR